MSLLFLVADIAMGLEEVGYFFSFGDWTIYLIAFDVSPCRLRSSCAPPWLVRSGALVVSLGSGVWFGGARSVFGFVCCFCVCFVGVLFRFVPALLGGLRAALLALVELL